MEAKPVFRSLVDICSHRHQCPTSKACENRSRPPSTSHSINLLSRPNVFIPWLGQYSSMSSLNLHARAASICSWTSSLERVAILCYYTQNIDCYEHKLDNIEWETVRLHGQVNQARCEKCRWKCTIDLRIFRGDEAPLCMGLCLERKSAREQAGKRSLKLGRLHPNILLCL